MPADFFSASSAQSRRLNNNIRKLKRELIKTILAYFIVVVTIAVVVVAARSEERRDCCFSKTKNAIHIHTPIRIMASSPSMSASSSWVEKFDEKRNRRFWYNRATKESTWVNPTLSTLTAGTFVERFDETHQRPFWFCVETKKSTWVKPPEEQIVKKNKEQRSSTAGPIGRSGPADVGASLNSTANLTNASTTVDDTKQHVALQSSRQQQSQHGDRQETSLQSNEQQQQQQQSQHVERQEKNLQAVDDAAVSSQVANNQVGIRLDQIDKQSSSSNRSLVSTSIPSPARGARRAILTTGQPSSFNTDREKTFQGNRLFEKQKISAALRSSADDMTEHMSNLHSTTPRRHYSEKVPSDDSLLVEPSSPVEAPLKRKAYAGYALLLFRVFIA